MEQTQQPQGIISKAQMPQYDRNAEVEKMVRLMPEKMRAAFENVVKAGKRVMYGPETREDVMSFLAQEAPLEEKIGTGIANLVILLDNKANGNLPKDVLIPAGTVLLFDLIGTLEESGEQITAQTEASAYQHMFYGIFAGYGVDPAQLDQMFDEVGSSLDQDNAAMQQEEAGQSEV
jgi:hypothetical protein